MLDTGNINHNTNDEFKKKLEIKDLCIIGNDVWIGSNAVILRGVKVGNGAVIGAGAIVTKDVEPYSIVVGNPARVIKKRFSEQIIESLEKIQWWNWSKEIIRKNLDLVYSSTVDEHVINKLMEISIQIK
nr:CatB-related O-acetyltransferase [Tissierella simiarum]